ncbi:hypothetical protein [Pontitalea aquivivens]|uniref:hypothetical protein n=1 Tax=Pontitalea aquivivens TaxID=3388663 RepID=UPI0039704FC2
MLIFWEQELVFLATPKTGSTAIEVALESLASVAMQRPATLKHLTARQYRAHLSPLLETTARARFTTVALMREPIGWLRSWYRFAQRDGLDDPVHALHGCSFDAFALAHAAGDAARFPRIASQSDFLCDTDGRPLVDRIFRYEDMDTFVQFLEDRLDCAITLPRVNVPPAADVNLSVDTETRLRSAMGADFTLYAGLR